MRLHGRVLDDRHEISFFEHEIGFLEALRDVAGAQLEMFGDVGHRALDDEFSFSVLGEVFVNFYAARLAGFLGIRIHGQIFVVDLDQFYRSLRDIFVFRCDRCDGLANKAHFALRQKWLVFHRLAVCPRHVFSGHDSNDAGKLFSFVGVNPFDLGMRLGAEQSFAVEHVGQHEIIAINRLAGDFLFSINALNRFTHDCQFRHCSTPKICSTRSNGSNFKPLKEKRL